MIYRSSSEKKNWLKLNLRKNKPNLIKILRTLFNEKDKNTFKNYISQISNNQQTCEFVNYFVSHCGNFNQSYAHTAIEFMLKLTLIKIYNEYIKH